MKAHRVVTHIVGAAVEENRKPITLSTPDPFIYFFKSEIQ